MPKKNQSKIRWSQGLADVGQAGGNISVIFSYIFAVFCLGASIVMFVMAARGRPFGSSGSCHEIDPSQYGSCNLDDNRKICNDKPKCQYVETMSNFSSGSRIGLIIGGIFFILFGIGVVLLTRYTNKKVQRNRNLAAVGGGAIIAEGLIGALGNAARGGN